MTLGSQDSFWAKGPESVSAGHLVGQRDGLDDVGAGDHADAATGVVDTGSRRCPGESS
jgi:hypothetical protein